MKRFWLFAGEDYYPRGGMEDFIGDFDSLDEAKAVFVVKLREEPYIDTNTYCREHGESRLYIYSSDYEWGQVVDAQTGKRWRLDVETSYRPCCQEKPVPTWEEWEEELVTS
jgi:hypothetical protein